jgi:predicted nicotinamide N-methyase
MNLALELHTLTIAGKKIQLYVPDPRKVYGHYQQQKLIDHNIDFPYWTRVWPAAKAISEFLLVHHEHINGKHVLELAAGLGLPSLIASRFAKTVHCSDYIPKAMQVVQKSIEFNHINNMYTSVLDWYNLPDDLYTDVLLLSDINYEPDLFGVLYNSIEGFISKGTTIILSTPQRLMAKPFIERLLPWCVEQKEIIVPHEKQHIATNVFVLRSTNRIAK